MQNVGNVSDETNNVFHSTSLKTKFEPIFSFDVKFLGYNKFDSDKDNILVIVTACEYDFTLITSKPQMYKFKKYIKLSLKVDYYKFESRSGPKFV